MTPLCLHLSRGSSADVCLHADAKPIVTSELKLSEMEFAGLDDDLFEVERERAKADEEYSARFCDDCWFMDVGPEELVSQEDTLSVQKYIAEYLFLRKDHDSAILKYKEILSGLPAGNTTAKRECWEGIARSHLKKGTPKDAIEFAEKVHATSKTVEQATVSCSLLVDVNLAAGEYKDALLAAQTLVTLHTFNSDAWLKLACVYAALHNVVIPNVQDLMKTSCSAKVSEENTGSGLETCDNNLGDEGLMLGESLLTLGDETDQDVSPVGDIERGVQFVAASLLRSYILLKKTVGTAVGFAAEFSVLYQKKILKDLSILLNANTLQYLRQQVLKSGDIMEKMSVPPQEVADFVDRGSSKFKSDENESCFEGISQQNFESRWFSWI
ncbi:uncharacterized protein C8orf76 homolog [Penaeus japonicus]|uniref:uncharacterized protein C8orf76 homolog n=1 Tax=Penaeus japonicus TaxID=27405 RepID=UPI001C712735|nr:uncharacterized protein C8orf76 homolog [Penaeus japonicus]